MGAGLAEAFPAGVFERPDADGRLSRAARLERWGVGLVEPSGGEPVERRSFEAQRGRRRGLGSEVSDGTTPPDSTWAMASSSAATPSPVAAEMGKTGIPRLASAALNAGNRSFASVRSIFEGATICGLAASSGLYRASSAFSSS